MVSLGKGAVELLLCEVSAVATADVCLGCENSVMVVSRGAGALGLIILIDDLDCSGETVIEGFGVDKSMPLMILLVETSAELACVDKMVPSMDSVDENWPGVISKNGVDSLLSTKTDVVKREVEVTEDVYMTA